ncbi:MAG: hypothetical protein FXF47_00850 [Candidatus Mcinerneyibacterium aminivorans]|uniref:Uncharacterized protein n=1 Tax=Candidatus Mcinerneyibacterium aminivorans TaxID=2703815 RepID=A0A5D0MGB4_9BACT|nr:MAG: hypothetical protein FXF47_00850 [Candidatus Mcinerneyibacterium aminivorans]
MKVNLDREEKKMLKTIMKKDVEYKDNIVKQIVSIILGIILVLGPIVYLGMNIAEADQVIKKAGVFLGIMILVGIILIVYFAFLKIQSKRNKELIALKSAIRKIIESGVVKL